MFCRFCGKQVDPSSCVCPYCGEPQEARTGGNGFWDILGKEPVQTAPQTAVKPIETSAHEGSVRKKGVDSRVLPLAVILGIACTVILGVLELSALQENGAAIQKLKEETAVAAQKNETAIQTLEEKMNLLREKLENTQPSPPGVFLGAPQVASAGDGTATVSVEASEEFSSQEIQWEYKLGEADWEPVADNSFFKVTGNGTTTLQITALEGQSLDDVQVRCYVQVGDKSVYSPEAVIAVPKG